jgi:DNA-binding response OmpR family regulator
MSDVLVIEDNEDNMELISFILDASGFSVSKAYNVKDGIEMALDKRPDFIIFDYMLPDGSGRDIVRGVRKVKAEYNPPMICMTALAMRGDREMVLSSGCNGYIEKPIDPIHVIDEINKILGK